jgi:hypothetical protein
VAVRPSSQINVRVGVARDEGAGEKLALCAVILSAALLAFVWAVRLPFFQQHDENAHADYSFTLFSTGRPVPRGDDTLATDVHPDVRYLEDVSGFRQMRRNLDGRVVPGYGTKSFFKNVDAGAPRVAPSFLRHNGRKIPYVARSYSYFYYALDALAIATGAIISHGSVTIEFFSARLLGIVLLAFTLAFSYWTMRELRIRPVPALVLLATIGMLPLTSWMSGSVQPDTLSFTAVALVFFLSVRLRREPRQLRSAAYLGIALGLLALTKSQYLVAVGIPALLDRTLRFSKNDNSALRWFACIALLLTPATFAEASVQALLGGANQQASVVVSSGATFFAVAAAHGAMAVSIALVRAVAEAWTSFFYHGFTFTGYWGEFSWSRTRLSFGSDAMTSLVFSAVGAFSVAVNVLIAFRLVTQIAPKLVNVAHRRGLRVAARLAASNVLLNAYGFFVVVMITIYVSTAGEVADEGRYWLPFALPALLCATVYAPRALSRGLRHPFAVTLGAGALAYSTLAALAAPIALQQRYYEPPHSLVADETLAIVRRLGPHRIARHDSSRIYVLTCCARVAVEGVAIDSRSDSPARSVDLLVDGRLRGHAQTGNVDPQLAYMLDERLMRSGFNAWLDLRGLASGAHELRLAVGERARSKPYLSVSRVRFSIKYPPKESRRDNRLNHP